MASFKEKIELLYQRPLVPVFLLVFKDGKRFNIDENSNFVAPHLKNLFEKHKKRLYANTATVELNEIKVEPDISYAMQVNIILNFSMYVSAHQTVASRLIKILADIIAYHRDYLPSFAAYIRDRIHPRLFFYAMTVAFAHSHFQDGTIIKGDIVNAFPLNFFRRKHIQKAANKLITMSDLMAQPQDVPSAAEETSSEDQGNESIGSNGVYAEDDGEMSYFREDVALNANHSYWHILYPFTGKFVNKHRRGELFYYSNQQMIARYNNARLCAYLNQVIPFTDYREPIPEGYFSKLRYHFNLRKWTGRPCNVVWKNVVRILDLCLVGVSDAISYRDCISESITYSLVRVDDTYIERTRDRRASNILPSVFGYYYRPLDLEMLGNLVEGNALTANRTIYGDLNNVGHILTAFSGQEQTIDLTKTMGIMGETTMAVRDPMYFRWHAEINDFFEYYKRSVTHPPYIEEELHFPEIKLRSVRVESYGISSYTVSTFYTHWTNTVIKIQNTDVTKQDYIPIQYEHLDHRPFLYKFRVENRSREKLKGTVRIFMAPRYDEEDEIMDANAQRLLFIELDKFVHTFKPGIHRIYRRSNESSVTIPLHKIFTETYKAPNSKYPKYLWPHHLLIPKGSETGYPYQLFVMISDERSLEIPTDDTIRDFPAIDKIKYLDPRPMGFPFDREFEYDVECFRDFAKTFSNMCIKNVRIIHERKRYADPRNYTVID